MLSGVSGPAAAPARATHVVGFEVVVVVGTAKSWIIFVPERQKNNQNFQLGENVSNTAKRPLAAIAEQVERASGQVTNTGGTRATHVVGCEVQVVVVTAIVWIPFVPESQKNNTFST